MRYTLKQYHHQDPATLFEVSAGGIQTGYIGYMEGNTGVYIPPGWLHCVYILKGGYLGTFHIDSPTYSHILAVIMTKQLLALHTYRDKVTETAQKPIVEVLTDVINMLVMSAKARQQGITEETQSAVEYASVLSTMFNYLHQACKLITIFKDVLMESRTDCQQWCRRIIRAAEAKQEARPITVDDASDH